MSTINGEKKSYDKKTFAKFFDHTILKPDATKDQVLQLCAEAKQYGFASVCVNSMFTSLVSKELAGSGVKSCAVVGFPLGAMSTEAKSYEAKIAARDGAEEIDMVIPVGALKNGDVDYVEADIRAVVQACSGQAEVKVIIETCLLTDQEKVQACEAAVRAGAHFVKTSTGFSTGGATAADISLMRKTVGPDLGVKASGGVRDYKASIEMIEAGASRIGSSSCVKILADLD